MVKRLSESPSLNQRDDSGRFKSTESTITRFFKKVLFHPNKCWIWSGTKNEKGYPYFSQPTKQRMIRAHRWAYLTFKGEIPKGYELDHSCVRRSCVNPSHLCLVTHRENIIRGHRRRRGEL